jgi:NADH-quinone oxidoreductase subunit N
VNVSSSLTDALTGFLPAVLPEVVLSVVACALFLGGTWKASRALWGSVALLALAGAGLALYLSAGRVMTIEQHREQLESRQAEVKEASDEKARADAEKQLKEETERTQALIYAAPVLPTRLGLLIKVLALVGGAVLLLVSWDEMPPEEAADFHGCLLLLLAGTCLVGSANDLITLFLALELISIPTYVMLYLPRADAPAQEAAMKYFLISVFSSALLLFGFSYLYGLAGTTNLPALTEALSAAQADVDRMTLDMRQTSGGWQGMALVALVMVVAAMGFRISAVPFHFYAPDVYQGTTTGMAALLAFVPKVAGFAALVRLLGLVPVSLPGATSAPLLGDKALYLLWIMAAVTMSLGNLLALLQDNVKRILAYSSVAHAGYMLIGLAVAPRLGGAPGGTVGGIEALFFYLVGYGAMTVGAFAVVHYLSTPERPVETVDDLAGAGRTHPGASLLMVLFLFSLIGIPLTAGFAGKMMLFFDALGLSRTATAATPEEAARLQPQLDEQAKLFLILAVIGVINAAIGAWYYLRIAGVMYLREGLLPLGKARPRPVLAAIGVCAALTLGIGVFPTPLLEAVQSAVARPAAPPPPPAAP